MIQATLIQKLMGSIDRLLHCWNKKNSILILKISTAVAACASIVFTIFVPREEEVVFLAPRFAEVKIATGAYLREKPDITSHLILVLKKKTIVKAYAETKEGQTIEKIGSAKWIKLKTRSGHRGWVFGHSIRFIREDIAITAIQRDIASFEDKIRPLIIEAAAERILSSGLHPSSRIADIRITGALQPETSASYNVEVIAYMVGKILVMNKFEVKCNVNLKLEIDENLLSQSKMRVRQVDITADRLVYGMTPQDTVRLFTDLLLHSFF